MVFYQNGILHHSWWYIQFNSKRLKRKSFTNRHSSHLSFSSAIEPIAIPLNHWQRQQFICHFLLVKFRFFAIFFYDLDPSAWFDLNGKKAVPPNFTAPILFDLFLAMPSYVYIIWYFCYFQHNFNTATLSFKLKLPINFNISQLLVCTVCVNYCRFVVKNTIVTHANGT